MSESDPWKEILPVLQGHHGTVKWRPRWPAGWNCCSEMFSLDYWWVVSQCNVDRSGITHYIHIREDLARWDLVFVIFDCATILLRSVRLIIRKDAQTRLHRGTPTWRVWAPRTNLNNVCCFFCVKASAASLASVYHVVPLGGSEDSLIWIWTRYLAESQGLKGQVPGIRACGYSGLQQSARPHIRVSFGDERWSDSETGKVINGHNTAVFLTLGLFGRRVIVVTSVCLSVCSHHPC